MGGIGHYNYQQYPLEQKYAWFQTGPGASAAIQVSESLKRIAARLDVSDGTIGAGFIERRLGTDWQGGAAQAASGAFDRAAVVLASLTTTSQAGGGTAQQFGDSFNATKNAIPVPPPPTGLNSAFGQEVDGFADAVRDRTGADLSVLGVQSDYRARLVANRNAEMVADDALYRHENTTRDALAAYQSAVGAAQPSGDPAAAPAGTAAARADWRRAYAGPGGGSPRTGGAPAGTAAGAAGGGKPAAGAGRPGTGGGTQGGARAGGGTSAGSGTPGGSVAGTRSAGWTPLDQGQASNPLGPSGGSTAGGYTAPGTTYLPGPPGPPWHGPGAGGYGGDHRGPATDQPLPPRTGEGSPAPRGGVGSAGGAAAGAAGGRGPGQGAMAPMGMGGAGAGGRDRDHRNQFYIPEDEPFRVEYDFFVAPPVIGAPVEQRDDR